MGILANYYIREELEKEIEQKAAEIIDLGTNLGLRKSFILLVLYIWWGNIEVGSIDKLRIVNFLKWRAGKFSAKDVDWEFVNDTYDEIYLVLLRKWCLDIKEIVGIEGLKLYDNMIKEYDEDRKGWCEWYY